jgi:hypothetical protein
MSQDTICANRPLSPSPPPCRPCHRGIERVIEHIVEQASSNNAYPTLTHSNYNEWSLIMMVNLQVIRLWDIVESGISDYREDQSTLATILRVVPQEMQAGLAVKRSAQEAWEAIRKIWLSGDRVKEANMEWLRLEFGDLLFNPKDSVEDFSLQLTTVASQL